ncbi:MAG TPA: hypothetical protein VK085_10500 [Pseudogracilibacillus sp.]|nr:hypothetical protein [Pseudogracilibacillus sp.]
MKLRIGFLLLLSFSLLIGCSTNAQSNTEQNDGEEAQSEQQTELQSDEDVVTIEDKTFTGDDLDFYTTMNQLKLVVQIESAEDDNTVAYIEEQRTYYENINVNLHSMIELYAMSLLAEEKNYFVPDEKLLAAVEDFNDNIQEVNEAVNLIDEYGEQKYNRQIEEYIRQTMLRDRVAQELEEELIEENPEALEEEINYLLEDKYDDLLMDQMSTLEMDIHLQ